MASSAGEKDDSISGGSETKPSRTVRTKVSAAGGSSKSPTYLHLTSSPFRGHEPVLNRVAAEVVAEKIVCMERGRFFKVRGNCEGCKSGALLAEDSVVICFGLFEMVSISICCMNVSIKRRQSYNCSDIWW